MCVWYIAQVAHYIVYSFRGDFLAYKEKSDAIRYNNQFIQNAYDRINLTVPKGDKDKIKAHAETQGESVNSFINRAISNQMEQDNGSK